MPARALSILLVLVLAATAWAQDPTAAALKKKWESSQKAFFAATQHVLSLTRSIQQIDIKKAELEAKIDAIEKQPSSYLRDRDRQNLRVELRTLLDQNDYLKLKSELGAAEREEGTARDAALKAGWDLVPRLFEVAERETTNGRQKTGENYLDDAARVLRDIGTLEQHKLAPPDPPVPTPDDIPTAPKPRAAFAEMCKDEAKALWDDVKKITTLCQGLEPQERHLASIVDAGYDTGGRAQNMLGLIRARLTSLEQRRQVLSKRALDYENLNKLALVPSAKAP